MYTYASVPVTGLYAIAIVFGVRKLRCGMPSDRLGLSAHVPGLLTCTPAPKLAPPFVERRKRSPWSSEVLHSSRT